MMIFLELYFRFFMVGLFAVGGGLATLPFLTSMGETTGWFTSMDISNMVAISESTPGPIGINMATYTIVMSLILHFQKEKPPQIKGVENALSKGRR